MHIVGSQVDVTDGERPVVVNVVDEPVDGVRADLVGVDFPDLHLAVEEGRVGSGEFVPQFDGETSRACVQARLLLRDVVSAATRLPPITFLCLVSFPADLQQSVAPGMPNSELSLAAAS